MAHAGVPVHDWGLIARTRCHSRHSAALEGLCSGLEAVGSAAINQIGVIGTPHLYIVKMVFVCLLSIIIIAFALIRWMRAHWQQPSAFAYCKGICICHVARNLRLEYLNIFETFLLRGRLECVQFHELWKFEISSTESFKSVRGHHHMIVGRAIARRCADVCSCCPRPTSIQTCPSHVLCLVDSFSFQPVCIPGPKINNFSDRRSGGHKRNTHAIIHVEIETDWHQVLLSASC